MAVALIQKESRNLLRPVFKNPFLVIHLAVFGMSMAQKSLVRIVSQIGVSFLIKPSAVPTSRKRARSNSIADSGEPVKRPVTADIKKPTGNHTPKVKLRHFIFGTANKVENVGKKQIVLRTDHFATAKTGLTDTIHEIVPVLQIE